MVRTSHSRVTITALLLLALVLGSGAWGAMRYNTQRGTHRRTDNTRQMYAYWWNDGACHGYPDVMDVYAVETDPSGAIVETRYDGQTAGSDSCGQYHPGYFPIAATEEWCACGGPEGAVLGDPRGSTAGHP